jgi:hypothetical protein
MRRWKNWRNNRLIERFYRCEFVEIRDKTSIPEQLLRSLPISFAGRDSDRCYEARDVSR